MLADHQQIVATLRRVASEYPSELIQEQLRDVTRIAYNIGLVANRMEIAGTRICDVGGGIGLFSVGCAALGMRTTLVDDFDDSVNFQFADVPKSLHSRYAVKVVSADVVAAPPSFEPGSFDVVTTFDSMEHWHNSPKRLFADVMSWLRPGGLLIVGVPNCVNLRKRLTGLFGRAPWSSMADWYEVDRFRGHVREPDMRDLRYIANDLRLSDVRIYGRNWLGYLSRRPWMRRVTPIVDVPLRMFPSLCADLYLLGTKAS